MMTWRCSWYRKRRRPGSSDLSGGSLHAHACTLPLKLSKWVQMLWGSFPSDQNTFPSIFWNIKMLPRLVFQLSDSIRKYESSRGHSQVGFVTGRAGNFLRTIEEEFLGGIRVWWMVEWRCMMANGCESLPMVANLSRLLLIVVTKMCISWLKLRYANNVWD